MKLRLRAASFIAYLSTDWALALRLVAIWVIVTVVFQFEATGATVFRYHIQNDPDSLDPARSASSISSYVLNSLYVPLMRYQEGRLEGFGAKDCRSVSPRLTRCQLRADWRWSDGQPVTAPQIVDGFKAMKLERSPRLDNFLNLKDVKARGTRQLDFSLNSPDSEFLYRLLDPAMGPRRHDIKPQAGQVTTGPYYLADRQPGRSLYLKPNSHFFIKVDGRPDVEVLIVDSDETALRLFQTGKLNFHRRLPTQNWPEYKDSPQLYRRTLQRFDYVGFSPKLDSYKDLRERLIYSLEPQYEKFKEIFNSIGRPGCFSLSPALTGPDRCYKARNVKPFTEVEKKTLPRLSYAYAVQGGSDIGRGAELFQAGWKKNLNLEIELRPTEYGLLSASLKRSPPPLFRRGVPLDRPTCLAALEIFESDSPENYIGLKDVKYDRILRQLRESQNFTDRTNLCHKGLQRLLGTHRIIPMGEFDFMMLNDHKFDEILINELNQLDVSRLHKKD